MSKKSLYGILAVIVALGLLLMLSQRYLGSGVVTSSATSGQPDQATPPAPSSHITEALLRQHWKELIASAPPPRGAASAPYQVIEIGDFQCPSCGKLKPLLQAVIEASGGRAKLYFVNLPLTRMHAHAMDAAEAGAAAAAQGQFWPMYDMLYADQSSLQAASIQASSRTMSGINVFRLAADMNSHVFKPAIVKQASLVVSVGTVSTPTVIVRAPNDRYTWYIGNNGTQTEKGVKALAAQPPWGKGLSDQQITSLTTNNDAG